MDNILDFKGNLHEFGFGSTMELFFQMSPDLFCIVSGEGIFLELNPAWEVTLGYTLDEVKGRNFTEFLHPEDIGRTQDEVAKQLAGGETLNFVNRYLHKDGSIRWLEWKAKATPDFRFLYAVARDVTESKSIKDLLNEQEILLHAITKSVRDPIIMLDGEGNITFWNEAASATLGYSSEEVLGTNLHRTIVPERFMSAHQNAFPIFQKTGQGGAIGRTVELFARHKDGREFPIELSLSAVKFNDVWCSIGIVHDITLRRKAESELRKLSQAMNQSPVSIVITDLNGNIEYANPKAVDTTGYLPEELIGRNPRMLKSGETPDSEYKLLWETISEGRQWQGLFHNKRKNGELYWESSTISPIIDSHGEITSFIAIKEDITEKKKISDELLESESKLREANITKDKLFSIIAHDLRGPIGNFTPILDVLTSEEYDLSDQERTRLMTELKKASHRTLSLLENLLQWSRSQSEKFRLNPVSLNIAELIERSVELFSPAATRKSLKISATADHNLLAFADHDSIDLVIRNLLSNALKFTPSGGLISLTVRDIGTHIAVEIADNGVGIPKEIADSLFKTKTFRSTEGTNREKGSGLGLVLCKDFVEKNGGSIRVESVLNEGSRFTFTLPKDQ